MELTYYICDICGKKDKNSDHISELYYSDFYDQFETDDEDIGDNDEYMHICYNCFKKYIKSLKRKELK